MRMLVMVRVLVVITDKDSDMRAAKGCHIGMMGVI